MSSGSSQPATRRGHEFARNAEVALREGKLEEAKMWHKNAWNAFKEARDSLMEGDTNTKMALKILIDFHREKEKNPGDPKHLHNKNNARQQAKQSVQPEPNSIGQSTSSSIGSLPEAWAAVQEFGEHFKGAATPPPLPEFTFSTKLGTNGASDWRKGQQSVMAESFLLVGGEAYPNANMATTQTQPSKSTGVSSPERGQSQARAMGAEIERLTKEVYQLRSLITKEREDAKLQREKFWKMFALVKAALEESNHESDLKALTRLLHVETEARKKAEAELESIRRSFA